MNVTLASKWNPPIVKSIGVRGPYSAMITSPATIVGRANGRSMIALTTDLPAKSSRTRTQAMIVPNTAVVSTASVDISSVSFSAETACGDETTSQKPAQPLPVDRQTTAAIGSTTMSSRKLVTKPTCRERAVEALSLRWAAGAGRPGASVTVLASGNTRATPRSAA